MAVYFPIKDCQAELAENGFILQTNTSAGFHALQDQQQPDNIFKIINLTENMNNGCPGTCLQGCIFNAEQIAAWHY